MGKKLSRAGVQGLSLPRRRLLGLGASVVALSAIGGCGGGGGGSSSSGPPDGGPDSEAPAGAFGGGQGRIAMMTSLSVLTLFDLASRNVLTTFDAGTESTVQGVTASPDGTIALLTRIFADSAVMVRTFDPDLGLLHEFQVELGLGLNQSAAVISPDGQRIAFSLAVPLTTGGTGWAVFLADIDGANQVFIETGRLVADLLTESANPVWLPDGRLLVQTDQDLLISDAALTTLSPALAAPLSKPAQAVIDRGGSRLLFHQDATAPETGTQIWSQDIESGALLQLTAGNLAQYNGAVSPDGEWLLFRDQRYVMRNGMPTTLVAWYVSALPLSDQAVDLSDRLAALDDSANELLEAESGLIAWF
jgi:WD40-like Beta Propeller Repeat